MRKTRRRIETRFHGSLPAASGRRRQRDVLRVVLVSASRLRAWLTLDELAHLTHYPQASISAQLRHLRKPQFGGFEVRKRQRAAGKILRGEDFGTVWEYQLRTRPRGVARRQPAIRRGLHRPSQARLG